MLSMMLSVIGPDKAKEIAEFEVPFCSIGPKFPP
jgi:hypothetical protein